MEKQTIKFVPTVTPGRKYNFKLVAISGDTNIYTYIDDDGDQMLVRNFNDTCRLPFVTGEIKLIVNHKTGRTYSTINVEGIGKKEDFRDIDLPESWRVNRTCTGTELREEIRRAANEAIEAYEYIGNADDDLVAMMDRKGYGKPSRKAIDEWVDKARDEYEEKAGPFLNESIDETRKISSYV